jgi:hypothetical protein
VYLPLLTVLGAAWLLRVTAFGENPWPASAAVATIPGWVVTLAVGLAYLLALVVAFRPRTWYARGELREERLRRP